jgi:hypothetical protein
VDEYIIYESKNAGVSGVSDKRNFRENSNSEAKIRFLHASPDAPKVDVYINNTLHTKDVSYKNVSEYMLLPLGKQQIDIYPGGNTENKLLSKKVTVESGKSYTLTIIGTVKNLLLISYLNQSEVPAGEAKIRYLNISPDSHSLDIAVKDRDVIFSELTFKKASEYLGITPMTIDLEIREAGTKNIILPLYKSKFSPNQVYTMVIVGFSKGNPEIEVLAIKD